MKALLALAAAAMLAAPSSPDTAKWSDGTPPARFQRTGFVPVVFIPVADVAPTCAEAVGQPPEGLLIVACTVNLEVEGQLVRVVIMPDPCPFADVSLYAQIACHENAHYLANWNHETE